MVCIRSLCILGLASLGASSAIQRKDVVDTPAPAATNDCIRYDVIAQGDTCWDIIARHGNVFTMSQLLCWNSEINPACSNLIPGRQVCVAVRQPGALNC